MKTEDGRTGKLGINDKHIGTGPPVEKGDMVQVLYTGKLKNGKQFDTNKKPGGKPMPVQVGGGNVIPGFDEGLVGMKKGGVRQLIIPPELGYGEQGNEKIPPNSELHFEIELLQIQAHAADANAQGPSLGDCAMKEQMVWLKSAFALSLLSSGMLAGQAATAEKSLPQQKPAVAGSGLQIVDVKAGAGAEARRGDTVTMNCIVRLKDGKIVDRTRRTDDHHLERKKLLRLRS